MQLFVIYSLAGAAGKGPGIHLCWYSLLEKRI